MNEKRLSIIIPVYNSKKFLSKCLDSVFKQTYAPLEVILIDDGSFDGSEIMCDEYASRYPQVKVIHQKNGGQTIARKRGIEIAQGDYISFVDSDDWVDSGLLEILMDKAIENAADLVTSGLCYEWNDRTRNLKDAFEEGTYGEGEIKEYIIPEMMFSSSKNSQGIVASLCGKIFSAQILKSIIGLLDERLTLGEDGALVYTFLLKAKNVVVTHYNGYHYVQHEESSIHINGIDNFEKIQILYNYLNKLKRESGGLINQSQITQYISPFIYETVKGVYDVDMERICCLPPFELIKPMSKVVIYGAGRVGRSFKKAIELSNYAKVVGWIDRYFNNLDYIDDVLIEGFDYVIIGISDKNIVEEVEKDLLSKGVKKEQIIWKDVKMI